ncbi:transcriptional regulator [Mesorhizobium tianshanense]|uniref:Transcriptional regulator, ArsR family n=1 Tax=Mesorhizobium tianshanense TaxID=39844 RepID=A0A562P2N0_9HYPH|nr:metalloregulator ArsR/SmtB family transcription factor [Mesorhizobium tianshanense]TWI38704.1 transcriptional regulator, ArsR family [Mesorhizobium tianshanense]GLS36639.1 transcriptional regulator [Mesorhizobium tianshanense]
MSLTDTFAALGNDVRLAIVERLLRDGELAAGDLVADGEMSAPAMSHHFRVLREAGIVIQRVDAQRRLYSVRPEAMRAIGQWSLTYREFWEQSLDRLGHVIEKEKRK